MKKVVLTFAVALCGFAALAQTDAATTTEVKVETVVQTEKVEIAFDKLPEAVSTAFKASADATKTVLKVYEVKVSETETNYELHVGTSDADKVAVIYNAKGELVK